MWIIGERGEISVCFSINEEPALCTLIIGFKIVLEKSFPAGSSGNSRGWNDLQRGCWFIGLSKEELQQSHTEVSLWDSSWVQEDCPNIGKLTQKALGRKWCVMANSSAASRPQSLHCSFPFPQSSVLCPGIVSIRNKLMALSAQCHPLPSFVCRVIKHLSSGFSRSHAFYGQLKEPLIVKDQVEGNTKISITGQEGSLSSYSQFEQL